MSSRARIMLQDFANNTAWVGKTAFSSLQTLYQGWEKGLSKPQKKVVPTFKQTDQNFANAHPLMVFRFDNEAEARTVDAATELRWKGPGFYMRWNEVLEVPAGKAEPLPQGPKWLVALEMWQRLAPTLSDRYRLFVSRDSRKHAWRHSLCNPFFQGWGHKAKPLKSKKPKAAIKKVRRSTYGGTLEAGHRDIGRDWFDAVTDRAERPPQPAAQRPTKPRVGIWS